MNGRSAGSLGKHNLGALRFTLCHRRRCLCNAGQKSIMSKLISCPRKLNRSRLKRGRENCEYCTLKKKIKNGFGPRPPLSNELERDAAGCCLDNAQVVHCVSAFGLISAANMGEKIQNIIYERGLCYGQCCKTFVHAI